MKMAYESSVRPILTAAFAVGIVLFVSITPALGQKEGFEAKRATSREGLMDTGYLTKADISDELDGSEDEYFYKFQAGPGKLNITLVVDANKTNAGAYLDLIGSNNNPIIQSMLVQAIDGGSERASESVKLAKKQEIIIRVKGLKYGSSGGYTGTYKITIDGPAATFREVAPPSGTDQIETSDAAAPVNPTQNNKLDAAPTAGEGQAKGSTGAPPEGSPGEKPAAPAVSKSKKSEKVEKVVDKAASKGQKLLDLIDKVKPKKP